MGRKPVDKSIKRPLTAKELRAACQVAEDEYSNVDIAAMAGIGTTTLDRWKAMPEFQDAVHQHVAALQQHLERYWIARKDRRVADYQSTVEGIHQVVAARAADETMKPETGANSGYLVRHWKQVGYHTVEEYELDTGLIAQKNATLKQAAIEVGQWTEQKDVTSGGESVVGIIERLMERAIPVYVQDDDGEASA